MLGPQADFCAESTLGFLKISGNGAGNQDEIVALGRGAKQQLGCDEGGHINIGHQNVRALCRGSDLGLCQSARDQEDLPGKAIGLFVISSG